MYCFMHMLFNVSIFTERSPFIEVLAKEGVETIIKRHPLQIVILFFRLALHLRHERVAQEGD